jgi:penicillin-binding protein 1A
MSNGTGSVLAVPIWAEFMKVAHEGLEIRDFEKPAEGLTTRLICKSSGGLATEFCPPEQVYTEIFKVGTEPGENEECFVHKPSIYLH